MFSFYKFLNIKIINYLLTKFSEKIYKYLRKSANENKLEDFRKIIETIHKTNFCSNESKPLLWDKSYPDHNLCTQQKVVQEIGFMKLSIPFVYFLSKKKKIIFPLSKNWIKKFQEHNFKVHTFLSRILNFFYLINFLIKGIIYFCSILIKYFNYRFIDKYYKNIKIENNIKIFGNVTFTEDEIKNKSKFHFSSWIDRNLENNESIIFLNRNIKKKLNDNTYCIPDTLFFYIKNLNFFKFFFSFLLIFIITIVDILFLNNSNLILFKEKIQVSVVRCSNFKKKLDFYFVFTQNIQRPLWTYEILKNKSTVSIICLNLFSEMKITDDKKLSFDVDAYHLCSWDKYFIWTDNCEKFLIERLINNSVYIKKKPEFIKIGLIYFNDLNKTLNLGNKKTIALFTYERHKFSPGLSTIAEWQYKNPKLLWNFYNQILSIANELNLQIIIKRKRNLENNIKIKRFESLFKILAKSKNVLIIDPRHSAYKVILNCDLVISQPFTSVGYAAKKLNKPSVYFDPTKQLKLDDNSANGVDVINDKILLKKWVMEKLKNEI